MPMFFQPPLSLIDSPSQQELMRRYIGTLLEETAEIIGTHSHGCRQLGQGEVLAQIGLDEIHATAELMWREPAPMLPHRRSSRGIPRQQMRPQSRRHRL